MQLKVSCSNFSPDRDTAVLFIQNFIPTLFLQTPFEGREAKGLQIKQLFPKMKVR